MKNYDKEVRERWGDSAAYKEYQAKTASYSADRWQEVNDGLNAVFAKFAECKNSGCATNSEAALALVKELKDYITQNFYACTEQILFGLGQMYVADERFKNNIDKHGAGTAEFVSEAIQEHCK